MADACIILYNATNAESLITAQDCLRAIDKDNSVRRRPLLLISNLHSAQESEREVLAKTGSTVASKVELCEFVELDVVQDDVVGVVTALLGRCPALCVGREAYHQTLRRSGLVSPPSTLERGRSLSVDSANVPGNRHSGHNPTTHTSLDSADNRRTGRTPAPDNRHEPDNRHSSLDLSALRANLVLPEPLEDNVQKHTRRRLKISVRTWMKKKTKKPYPLLNSLLPSSDDSSDWSGVDADTALGVVSSNPKLKDAFIAYLSAERVQKYRFLFYVDVRQYRTTTAVLGRAHLLYQKYLEPDSLYGVDLEPTIGEVIYEALWADPDGVDSEGLVTEHLFDAAAQAVEAELEPLAETFLLTLSAGSTSTLRH